MGERRNDARDDFDERLVTYTAEAAPCLNRSSQAASRWLLYSAAAGVSVASALTADAAVIYSGEQNLTVGPVHGSQGLDSALIDVNLDGHADLNLAVEVAGSVFARFSESSSFLLRSRGHRTRATARLEGLREARIITEGDAGQLRNISGGLIGPAMNDDLAVTAVARQATRSTFTSFDPAGARTASGTRFVQTGEFSTGLSFFAGFRFGVNNDHHFGWIRLFVDDTDENGVLDQLTAVSWAYESAANQPLDLGHTIQNIPEPGTLALATLATGCAGLAALRSRRKPPQPPTANR